MVIFFFLLIVYFIMASHSKYNKNFFLLLAFILIIAHSLFLYTQFGQATGGSDEDFYIENAEALNKGWNHFLTFRDYFPSSYYGYSIFIHYISYGIENEFVWVALVRLCNAIVLAIALLPYSFVSENNKKFGHTTASLFIYTASIWLVMFNFRDAHILAILLSLYSINYILKISAFIKLLSNITLLVLIKFYKPELYLFIFSFPIVKFVVNKMICKNYCSAKLILIMLIMFLPLAYIKLPAPLDYFALRMVYNNEVDINEHTLLTYDPVKVYEQGNTTVIGKTIVERVYKRFPVIFVGYNPLVMLFDYTKSFNSKFGIDLTMFTYALSQLVFFLYYFILNPVLIVILVKKRFINDMVHQHLISLFLITVFYYSLYNVLQGSAQPRITIPLTALIIYTAYRSNFLDLYKRELLSIVLFIMIPIMILHYTVYAFNLIS